MRLNYVIDRFALISSLEGEELSKWVPLCVDAMEEVASLAQESALKDESKVRRLSNYAGALAYYRYCLYSSDKMKSVTVGALSISEGDSALSRAKELLFEEKAANSDLMKTSGDFSFMRVVV